MIRQCFWEGRDTRLSMLSDRELLLEEMLLLLGVKNRCFSCSSQWSLLEVTLAGWPPANTLQGKEQKSKKIKYPAADHLVKVTTASCAIFELAIYYY